MARSQSPKRSDRRREITNSYLWLLICHGTGPEFESSASSESEDISDAIKNNVAHPERHFFFWVKSHLHFGHLNNGFVPDKLCAALDFKPRSP
jgi:hypothetical protein